VLGQHGERLGQTVGSLVIKGSSFHRETFLAEPELFFTQVFSFKGANFQVLRSSVQSNIIHAAREILTP
jgi:hypothetical protein